MTKPVLTDFYAEWCGPCRMQSPIIDKLKEIAGDKVDIRKVDIDKEMELTSKYAIEVVPTLIIEKDGKVVHRREGLTDVDDLLAILKPLMD